MKKINIIALFILLTNTFVLAGPWAKQKGKAYLKLSEWWTVFDQHYTDLGLLDPNVTTGVFNTTVYAEYGITDKLTAIANASLLSRTYMNNLVSRTTNEILVPGEAINAIGDIDLGIKYGIKITDKQIPLSISLYLGIPTGESAGGSQGNLQTGDGEFNQLLQLDSGFGSKLGSIPVYFTGYVGVNNRSNGYSDELRFGLEAGLALLNKKIWINSRFNVIESFKNGATAETITSTSIFSNNSEFSSLGVEANVYLTEKIGLSAGIAGAFRGEIIAAAPAYNVGVFLDLK